MTTTTTRGPTAVPASHPTGAELRPFSLMLLLLAALLLVNTALGPLGLGVMDYDLDETLTNQLLGLELVTVLLVVPVGITASVLSLRGHVAGPLLAMGPSAYAAYMFVQYVLGPEYTRYSLTVWFHLTLMTLAGALTLWAWRLSAARPPAPASPRQRRLRGVLLLGFAGFVLLRYAGGVVGAWTGEAIAPEFAEARTFFWSIFLLDLGVVVPVTAVAAAGALAGRPWADRAVLAVLGWFALVPPSVVAMAVVMLVRDDPNASASTVALLSVATLVFGAVAVQVFRHSLRRR